MLRRSAILQRSRWERAMSRARQEYSMKHRTEHLTPVDQRTPTFAQVRTATGAWRAIDTSFVDIPDVDEAMPLGAIGVGSVSPRGKLGASGDSVDVAEAVDELDALQHEIVSSLRQAKAATTPALLTSQAASASAALAPVRKSPAVPARPPAEVFERRAALAAALRQACERFVLMDQEGFEHMRSARELNSGPSYETSDMKLKRRRAWFSLRNSFLSAAPSLFLAAGARPLHESLLRADDGTLVAAALRSCNEACSLLVWMHSAASFSGKWAEPVSWDRRAPSDFEKIDFGYFAQNLLQHFSAVVSAAAGSGGVESLDNFVALCTLCRRCGVDEEVMRSTVLDASALLAVANAAAARGKLPALSAVSLGLCCHDDAALRVGAGDVNTTDGVGTVLLRAVAADAELASFGSLELCFLLELLQRIARASGGVPDAPLFRSVLGAAQRRMRALMDSKDGHGGAEVEDTFNGINPLQRVAEHYKRNAGAAPLVFDNMKLYRQQVHGVRPGAAQPAHVVRFFKLLSEISAPSTSMATSAAPTQQKQAVDDASLTPSQVAGTWARDIVSRALHSQLAGSQRAVDVDEALSLLEVLPAAAPLVQSGELERAAGMASKTIRDLAPSMRSVRDVVKVFRCATQLLPHSEAAVAALLTCVDALELRLLRALPEHRRPVYDIAGGDNVLTLQQCAELSRCFVALRVFPRLALVEFGDVALHALRRRQRPDRADALVGDALSVLSCLFRFHEQQPQQQSSAQELLARLVGSVCSHIAPPSATMNAAELARLPARMAARTAPLRVQFLPQLLRLLASPVLGAQLLLDRSARRSVAPLFLPLQRTCAALILASSGSGAAAALDGAAPRDLLLFCRAAVKLPASAAHREVAEFRARAVAFLVDAAASQSASSPSSSSLSFLEMVEVLQHHRQQQRSSVSGTAVAAFLAQSLDDLRAAVFSLYGQASSSAAAEEEVRLDAVRQLLMLDVHAISTACLRLIRCCSQSGSADDSAAAARLVESCVRFLVCSFVVERAKTAQGGALAAYQQKVSGVHDEPVRVEPSPLGFERAHVAKQRVNAQQRAELRVQAELLQYSIAVAGERAKLAAEAEWKMFA